MNTSGRVSHTFAKSRLHASLRSASKDIGCSHTAVESTSNRSRGLTRPRYERCVRHVAAELRARLDSALTSLIILGRTSQACVAKSGRHDRFHSPARECSNSDARQHCRTERRMYHVRATLKATWAPCADPVCTDCQTLRSSAMAVPLYKT